MPDRAVRAIGGFLSGRLLRSIMTICPEPRDCGRKRALRADNGNRKKYEEYFVFGGPAPAAAFNTAAFEARCTDCNRRDRKRPIRNPQSAADVAFGSPELAATMRCIIAMNRFCSALLRSATVSRCAARADASIWRSKAAPDFVSRQICARRSLRWIDRSINLRDCKRLSAPVVVVRSSTTSAAKVVWSAVPRWARAESRLYWSGVTSKAAHRFWNSAT
jgi:hypothetical protein